MERNEDNISVAISVWCDIPGQKLLALKRRHLM